ncbi:MAG: hypothetical protein ACO39X_05745 [Candidatus Nanopelagicaceae bacterium]
MDRTKRHPMKEVTLLEKFILDAPASNSEHQQALAWLKAIIESYEKKLYEAHKSAEKA